MSEHVLRIGLVGCGVWGRLLLQTLDRCSVKTKVVALVDVDEDSITATTRSVPFNSDCEVFSSLESLFSSVDVTVDAIIIATPEKTHTELIKQALTLENQCVSIFSESPIAYSVRENQELLNTAMDSYVILNMNLHTRFDVEIARARNFEGDIRCLRYTLKTTVGEGRDGFYDLLPLAVDSVLYIMGSKKIDTLTCHRTEIGSSYLIHVTIHFEDGSLAVIDTGFCLKNGMEHTVDIQGADGSTVRFNPITYTPNDTTWWGPVDSICGFTPTESMNEFLVAVSKTRAPEITAVDALRCSQVVIACQTSLDTGSWSVKPKVVDAKVPASQTRRGMHRWKSMGTVTGNEVRGADLYPPNPSLSGGSEELVKAFDEEKERQKESLRDAIREKQAKTPKRSTSVHEKPKIEEVKEKTKVVEVKRVKGKGMRRAKSASKL